LLTSAQKAYLNHKAIALAIGDEGTALQYTKDRASARDDSSFEAEFVLQGRRRMEKTKKKTEKTKLDRGLRGSSAPCYIRQVLLKLGHPI